MKYRYKEDKYSSHSKIIQTIRKKGRRLKILDIGCASGYIGRELGKSYRMVGIDFDKEPAKKAKKYYEQVIIADIDAYKANKNKFDVIIFGDVLEHLQDPVKVLKNFKKQLSQNGIIIISLPNIALWVLRLKLLFGNFDYAEKGPMDKTHLHFYTLKTALQLIRKAGLKTRKYHAIPVPLPLLFDSIHSGTPLYFLQNVNYWMTQLWKKGCAYQFVFVVST